MVGGGVVGAGAAVDAVTRGLSVGILQARDWASGTSRRSSKLIHGGLRYLEMFDFQLVREALRERGLLLQRLAPHLVRPVPFVCPLTHRGWERLYVGAGLTLYDALASVSSTASGVPRHKHLSKGHALRLVPSLRKDALVGAVEYYDAQVDDARHTMFLVRTAMAYGALAANRSRVTGFIRQGERVTGVRVRDLETCQELEIRAKQVLDATGVCSDETQSMVGERGQFRVRASKDVEGVYARATTTAGR
jgi:glycerol-3-phosphate dehydrogenase